MLDRRGLGWLEGIIARCKGSCAIKSEECAGKSEEQGQEKQREGVSKEEGGGWQEGRECGLYHGGHGERNSRVCVYRS